MVAFLEGLSGDAPPPSVEALAAKAALSPYHFHRVFRLMTGETVAAFLRRLRLARSLPTLEADGRVTDAAGAAGYATSQAYARALRTVIGGSASAARADGERLAQVALQLAQGVGGAPVAIEIISADPMRLVAVRNTRGYAELNLDFERLFDLVFATESIERLRGVHGVFERDPRETPPSEFRCLAAVELASPSVPDGVIEYVATGGLQARARHVGDYARLLETIDGVYAACLGAGLEFGQAPVRVHYIDTPEAAPADVLRSDIYLALGVTQ